MDLLCRAFGVRLRIYFFDAEGRMHSFVVGGAGAIYSVLQSGRHYDAVGPDGRVIRIRGDGSCAFAAFFRSVMGRYPSADEIAHLREHAAENLGDEEIAAMIGAVDDDEAEMGGLGAALEQPQPDEREPASQPASEPRAESAAPGGLGVLDDVELRSLQDLVTAVGADALIEALDHPSPEDDEAPESSASADDWSALEEELRVIVEEFDQWLAEHDGEFERQVPPPERGGRILEADDSESEDEGAEESEGAVEETIEPIRRPGGPPDDDGDGGPPGRPSRPGLPPRPVPGADRTTVIGQPAPLDEIVGAVGAASDLTGFVGTEGSNNAGQNVAGDVFKHLVDDWLGSQGDILMSGISDAGGAAFADAPAVGILVAKAIATLRDPDASSMQRRAARLDLVNAAARFGQAASKMTGGVLHSMSANDAIKDRARLPVELRVHRIGGQHDRHRRQVGRRLRWCGRGAARDRCHPDQPRRRVRQGRLDERRRRRGHRSDRPSRHDHPQRSGGDGQGNVADRRPVRRRRASHRKLRRRRASAFTVNLVPVLGATVASGNAFRQGVNIHKFRRRRRRLKRLIAAGMLARDQRKVVEFIRSILKKRIKRAAVDIALDSAAVVGGVVQASGVGAGAGLAISTTSGLVKLSVVGHRAAKQKLRDRSAQKREKSGKSESYEDWEARQLQKPGKAQWVLSRVNVLTTMNWDKSSRKKALKYLKMARRLITWNDDGVFRTIGLKKKHLDKLSDDDKMKTIIEALRKR